MSENVVNSRYSIAGTILDGVARQIMRLTESTEKVKPEDFEEKLASVSIGSGLAENERTYQVGAVIEIETLTDYVDFESNAVGSLSQ